MKNKTKFLSVLIVFAILFSFTGPIVAGAKDANSYNEEVKDLAEKLEFVFEEAAIKDESGNIIGLDIEKIEAKYGETPELRAIQQQIEEEALVESGGITTYGAALDNCINNKIVNNWKEVLGVAAISSAIDYVTSGKYLKAAQKLVSAGVRGNAITMAGTLAYWFGSCLAKVS